MKAIDETKKADSIRRIERILDGISPEILEGEVITGRDDLRDAIDEYRAITREGLTPEEYIEEKESAFEAIVEAAEGLDIDEDALGELEKVINRGTESIEQPAVKIASDAEGKQE